MKIRKQVYELTLQDLAEHPVWEFALDEEGEEGQDETTVRPYSETGPADPSDGMLVVKANFVLADGTQLFGYLTPPVRGGGGLGTIFSGDDGLGTIQPQIITPRGQVSFWLGARKPSTEDLEHEYDKLERRPDKVFPLHFANDAEVLGGRVEGIVNAFLYLDLETRKVHEVR